MNGERPDAETQRFVVEEESCRFFAAERIIITLQTSLAELYLAHVMFQRRDGSIFVQCPKFRHRDGLLRNVDLEPDGSFPGTINMQEGGRPVSHLVKYSHHPNGRVHFSQDGLVRTEVLRSAAFPLTGPIGKLFFLNACYPTGGFLPVNREREVNRGNLILRWDMSDRLPPAVQLRGEWRRKVDVPRWTRQPHLLGPRVDLVHRVTGAQTGAFLVGQPDGYPLTDHVLVLFCDEVQLPAGATRPSMIFMGGSDSDEVPEPGMPAPPSPCLAWFYPRVEGAELQAALECIDYIPGGDLEAADDLQAEPVEEQEDGDEPD